MSAPRTGRQLLPDSQHLAAQLRDEQAERAAAEESLALAIDLLRRMESKRRSLAAALVRTQEQERQHIASYIHDESIQAMAVAGLRLEALRERLTDPALIDATESIAEVVADAVSRLRNLLFELDPTDLEVVGLGRVLRSQMGQYFRDSGATFTVRGRFAKQPPYEIRRTMYRIVHEAIVNSRKHASASRVSVVLSGGAEGYLVTIDDDGRGFDVDAVTLSTRPGHVGLRMMTDRARLAGGALTITSARRRGTTVELRLPDPEGEILLIGERQARTG